MTIKTTSTEEQAIKTKKTTFTLFVFASLMLAGTSQADAPRQTGSESKAHVYETAQAQGKSSMDVPADAQAAANVADRFSEALQTGDMKAVEAILDPDVLILESGGAERTRKQYLGHHAIADAKFLKSAHVQLIHRTARRSGDLTWIGSESEIRTKKGEEPRTLLSTETMILQMVADDWRIVHIHWSSHPKS